VLFGAEYSAWGGSGFTEMRDQTLRPDQYASYGNSIPTPSEIEQTVAVCPTPQQAKAFLETSHRQWERCASGEVRRKYIESGHTFTIGEVHLDTRCRDATKIDKTRLATLTKLRCVAEAC
jgi:PknH-like extracellular domain